MDTGSQLSLRRTSLGQAYVHLKEMSVEGGKAKQGPTLGVHFTGVSSKREPTVLYYPFT